MSKLYNANIHMQLTRSQIKHIYTKKENFCMRTHFYAIMQSQSPSLQTNSAVFSVSILQYHIGSLNLTYVSCFLDITPFSPLSVSLCVVPMFTIRLLPSADLISCCNCCLCEEHQSLVQNRHLEPLEIGCLSGRCRCRRVWSSTDHVSYLSNFSRRHKILYLCMGNNGQKSMFLC